MKKVVLFLGLGVLSIILISLFMRVSYLENRQKAFAALPPNTLQTPQGNLEKVGSSAYTTGNTQAAVTLIEYSDFECPSCQRMHPVFQRLLKQYGKDIRFVESMFPLPVYINAKIEAVGFLCAGKIGGQGIYWRYTDEIFKRTAGIEGGEGFALGKLIPLSKELGISETSFMKCLDTGEMTSRVQQEKLTGETAGVSQLPALFIIDKKNHVTLLSGEQSLPTLQVILTYTIQE